MTQTSIPMESRWNKLQVAIPVTIVAAVIIFGSLYLLGGASKASNPEAQSPRAEELYKQWEAERDTRECNEQKKVAQANYEDVRNGFGVDKDMNSLKAKIIKDCGWNIVPTTKALSFETSSFNHQNNDSTTSNRPPSRVHNGINNTGTTEISSKGLKKELRPIHHGSPEQQKYIDYAWNTYHDKNLIYLMKAENGLITPDRKHTLSYGCPKKRGVFNDWGFGGISDCWHPKITSDPRFFNDPYWQIDQVYRLYKGGTKFHSRPNWPKMAKYFDWV